MSTDAPDPGLLCALAAALGRASSRDAVASAMRQALGARELTLELGSGVGEPGEDVVARSVPSPRGRVLAVRAQWPDVAPGQAALVQACADMALPVVEGLEMAEQCARLRSDLARRDFNLYTIYQVGRDLGSVLDLDEILRILTDVMAEVLMVRLACVLMKDEEADGWWCPKAVRIPLQDGEGEMPHIRFPEGERVGEWLMGLGWETRAVDDLEGEAFQAAFPGAVLQLRNAGIQLVAPLMHEHRLLGLLALGAKVGANGFTRADQDVLSVLAPLASHALSNARLYQQAVVDGLTQVHVVRYFRQRLREELQRGRRYSYPVGLILMDVDEFKQVNDVHGHLVGDRLLHEIACCVGASCRIGADLVGRYGGDEFIVMLPQTSWSGALVVAERIRGLVASTSFTDRGLQVHVSCGVASFPEQAGDDVGLIACADENLLRAKREGRDRVCSPGLMEAGGGEGGDRERQDEGVVGG